MKPPIPANWVPLGTQFLGYTATNVVPELSPCELALDELCGDIPPWRDTPRRRWVPTPESEPVMERPRDVEADAGPVPGQIWDVTYVDNIVARSGFLNQSGLHEVYKANGGQLYFRRLQDDGAGGNLAVRNPLIAQAMLHS